MNNILGIVISILFVIVIIGISTVLSKFNLLSTEGSRKFIHIGVGNWWLIAMFVFDNKIYASIVPALFVIINYISYKKSIFKAMERNGERGDLGTVYYAISLLILTLITFGNGMEYVGALGILTMTYGDGLAAVIGTKYGKHKFKTIKGYKSIEGTITMFISTFIVCAILLRVFTPLGIYNIAIQAIILAIIGTLLELYTPYGFDNLTVPLGVSFIYLIIFL